MHAGRIIQDLLADQCPSIHAKRRHCLALMIEAARSGGLGLLKMSKSVQGSSSLRHRIKRCDRLLSNPHLATERVEIFRAVAQRVLQGQSKISIIVDWSDLLADISQHVLRAAVVVKGRAIVIYEEIHPTAQYGAASVHREFMKTLRSVLPAHCQPLIITDAGFRAAWFKMLDQLGFAWIGRIRNRDMVTPSGKSDWRGCKEHFADTKGRARDLGSFNYVRSNPVPCRLVMIKRVPKGRTCKTVFGKKSQSHHSKKQSAGQREPWLLAVSPRLSRLSAKAVVNLYQGRMQIEQTFRDLKSSQWEWGSAAAKHASHIDSPSCCSSHRCLRSRCG
ncbi:IS4 family transposase [Massilia cavernae]|uniref:IS4 family transposase n=2 Tax=Massilia cavernae TaxID=2320864 RepID=A0A418Y109_9BURK|nr:IS4 family transposase [Massilia cavernae]